MRPRLLMNLLGLVLVSAPSLAQVPASERIPLTDPARLKRMGFPSDARNVFVWSKLDRAGDASLDEKTAAARKTWGTQTGSTTVAAMALQKSLADSKLQHNLDLTFCTHSVPGGAFAVAQFQLPEGASLGDFNSWAFDADPDRDGAVNYLEYLTGSNPLAVGDNWKVSIHRTGAAAQISFPQIANRGFELQFSYDLSLPIAWEPLDVPGNHLFFPTTNLTALVEDSVTNAPTKFYRVRVFEP